MPSRSHAPRARRGRCWRPARAAVALFARPPSAQTSRPPPRRFENAQVPLQRRAAVRLPARRRPRHARGRLLGRARPREERHGQRRRLAGAGGRRRSRCPTMPARPPPTSRSATARRQFKEELPEAVCGEADRRPRQDRQRQAGSRRGASRVHGRCHLPGDQVPGARRAARLVQFSITPGLRYRLMARALKEDFEQRKEAVDAFFASFSVSPASES